MGRFDSAGAGAARGIRAGFAIGEAKKSRESDEQKERDKRFKAANDELLEASEEGVTFFGDLAVSAAEKGASEEQQLEFRNGAQASAMGYAGFLKEQRRKLEELGEDPSAVPDPVAYVERQMARFDARAAEASIEDTSEDFETLSPEETAKLGFPEGAIVQRGPDNKVTLTFDPTDDESVTAERIRLLEPFVGEERAVGIATNRFVVSTNAITNESVVLDIATGEPVGEKLEPLPEADVPSIIPEDIDTNVATGIPGAVKNAVNLIKDAVGAGVQFPKAQEATEALNSIQVLTTTKLQAAVPGRPSVFLLEQFKGLTVTPNSIFQGEDRSKTRLEQTRRLLDGEIQRMEQEVLPLELDPKTRVETQLNLSMMKRLRDAYDGLLKGFDEDEDSDIDPEIKKLLDKHAPEDEE